MSAPYTRAGAGQYNERVGRPIHLSDKTVVWLDYNGGTLQLYYSPPDRSSVNVIATVPSAFTPAVVDSFAMQTAWDAQVSLCRDSSDNIYVVGNDLASAASGMVKAYKKTGVNTWTGQTILHYALNLSANYFGNASLWCNTTGGTSGAGHLLVSTFGGDSKLYAVTLDAGAALAGSGTLLVNSYTQPAFLGGSGSTYFGGFPNALSPDGFGATSGLAISATTSTTAAVGSWAVNSSGALSTNTGFTAITTGTLTTGGSRVRVVRVASGKWAIAYPSNVNSGRWKVGTYNASGVVDAPVEGPASLLTLNGSTALLWEMIADPGLSNVVWIFNPDSSTQTTMDRLKCDVSGTPTWDTSVLTADTLAIPAGTTPSTAIQAVGQPIAPRAEWWEGASDVGLYGDSYTFSTILSQSLADGAAAVDSLSRTSTRARTLADGAAAADSLVRTNLKRHPSLVDNATAADSLVMRQNVRHQALADGAAAADVLTRARVSSRTLADGAAAADVLVRTQAKVSRALADAAAAADVLVHTSVTYSRVLTDAAAALDVLSRVLARLRSLADGAAAADSLTHANAPYLRSLADAAAASDSLSRLSTRARTLADNAAAADVLVRTQAKVSVSLADGAAASDALSVVRRQFRTLADGAAAVDFLPRSPTFRAYPDAILSSTNYTGAVADLQDDPDTPAGTWVTATDPVTTSVIRVSFIAPGFRLAQGANRQEFRVLVRRST